MKKGLSVLILILFFSVLVFAEEGLVGTEKETAGILNKAAEYHLRGEFSEEIEALNKAIKLDPRCAESYYKRCLAYYGLGRYDKAREDAYRAELEGVKISLTFIDQLRRKNEEFEKRKQSYGLESLKDALAKEGLSLEEFGRLDRLYYDDPRPDELIRLVRAMLSDNWSIYDISGFGPLAHFVATVARNDPVFFDNLKKQRDNFTGTQRDALEKIIYETDNFRSPKPVSPQGLDYLWAEFFATGSDEPVKKIISALGDPGPDSQMTKYSAQWSLKANAKQDKNVRRIIKNVAANSRGELKEALGKILK
jgi:tetratricopeptide (TPR) repeat protein